MGDKPTEVDCAMFGMLSQFLWNTPGSPFEQLLQGNLQFQCFVSTIYKNLSISAGEFNNLKIYCELMKKTFWPDWDCCLNP